MGKSASLESSGYLWSEEGESRVGMVAEVAPALPVNKTYTFAVPPDLAPHIEIGQRVTAYVGRRKRSFRGYVVSLDRRVWDSTLEPIESLDDGESYLSADLVDLARDISSHYACPLGLTLKAMVPGSVHRQSGLKRVRYAQLALSEQAIKESGVRLTDRRKAVVDALRGFSDAMSVAALMEQTGASTAVLRAMADLGLISVDIRREIGEPLDDEDGPSIVEPSFELTEEQQLAMEKVNAELAADKFAVTLLFGVSGSGKTEVYIRAIQRVLAAGRQAIMLVPEIVLTTQLARRLASRLPRVALVHSGLTDAQRSVMWRHIASGAYGVVIGTRSAVFAPCPNVGLIVVDEEQESSYKNLQTPRFHVRDVAIMRAKRLGIPVVLGSATPSLETWHNCETRKHFRRISIRHRVNALPLPKIHVVDMRDEITEARRSTPLSRVMEKLLGETLLRGEQAILLMNRRGFSPRVVCPACKTRLQCPRCQVGLVVHKVGQQALCHYCHHRVPTPEYCPVVNCGERLVCLGLGTQRVEEYVQSVFPEVRLARVDSDTMRNRRQYEELVAAFEARNIDLLIGTQMIAKGLDFPHVSFVGALDADPAGLSSDYRAQERLFQLVTQVAGRAGRADRPGQVVVQTTTPELPALQHALSHDYEAFAKGELDSRHRVGLPPFTRLTRIILTHERDDVIRAEVGALADRIRAAIETRAIRGADVLGPNPCPIARMRDRYRYELLVRTATAKTMSSLLAHLRESASLRTRAKSLIVDVDPVAMS